MNPTDDFDRNVSDWFHADAEHRVPAHLESVLRRTRSERQRPAWSSLERWLPVQSTIRFAPVPRIAWLLVILGLLVALTATALAVGSRRSTPSPFGVNSHGTVLYGAADGDIYALDTATNQSRPLVVGPAVDRAPSFSPDGTKFVFFRTAAGGTTMTMLADADGSNQRVLTPKVHGTVELPWSPAGDQLAYAGEIDGAYGLFTIGLDGTTRLVVSRQPGPAFATLEDAHWRSDGQELVFLWGHLDIVPQIGLYAVKADGTGTPRAIVKPTAPALVQLSLSPDGSKATYSIGGTGPARLHVVDLDSGVDTTIAFDESQDDRRPVWSADSSRLVFERHSAGSYRLAVGPVDGGPVVLIGPTQPDKVGGSHAQFSPDGTRVLAFYDSDRSSWVLDPADGSAIQLGTEIRSPLTWQSSAP